MAEKQRRKAQTPSKEEPRKAEVENGSERRDIESFPDGRNAGEFGTHGGPKQRESTDADDASESPRE